MHPFSGSALFSLKKRAGCFTFIVFFVSCLWSLCSNFCWAYCETPFCVVASMGAPNNGGNTQCDIYATAGEFCT